MQDKIVRTGALTFIAVWIAVLIVAGLAACHDVVSPKHCTAITHKGGPFHDDTTEISCQR